MMSDANRESNQRNSEFDASSGGQDDRISGLKVGPDVAVSTEADGETSSSVDVDAEESVGRSEHILVAVGAAVILAMAQMICICYQT